VLLNKLKKLCKLNKPLPSETPGSDSYSSPKPLLPSTRLTHANHPNHPNHPSRRDSSLPQSVILIIQIIPFIRGEATHPNHLQPVEFRRTAQRIQPGPTCPYFLSALSFHLSASISAPPRLCARSKTRLQKHLRPPFHIQPWPEARSAGSP
jgi:hypothetical protein